MSMYGELMVFSLESAAGMGSRVDRVLNEWHPGKHFLLQAECPRFSSGEAKCVLRESVRDRDVCILVDVCNTSLTYRMFGEPTRMSPDDHYQDLKRVIAACGGKAGRISVIMPFLYESRQHRKTARESLDCAVMLRELESMGVRNPSSPPSASSPTVWRNSTEPMRTDGLTGYLRPISFIRSRSC